jgi:SRSO17 transposase
MRRPWDRCCSTATAEWSRDAARCQEAGVPDGTTTVPKPTLGTQLLERAFAAGVQADWVTADSIYGGDGKLRRFLEDRQQAFVLAVPSSQHISLTQRADTAMAQAPAAAWQRLSAGEGSQGPRWDEWGWMPLDWRAAPDGWAHGLLARRTLNKPGEIASYLVFGPESVTLPEIVRVAGTRWQVEEAFALAKGEVGLDEYEVRHWVGWYRHITLAMLALAYLTVVKVPRRQGGASLARGPRAESS